MKNEEQLKEAINNTGFILENEICNILEKAGWNVINNRYYIDSDESIEREIDAIAYKVKTIEDVAFYTVLIISCKKSSKDIWTFLTKKIKKNDPNINFFPVYNKTNNKIIDFMLSKHVDISKEIKDQCKDNEWLEEIYGLKNNVFAFQQLEPDGKSGFKAKSDKFIYNSIITTIKAYDYESKAVLNKKNSVFYNFHLLSVYEGEMVEFFFKGNEFTAKDIDSIKYLNRHIINGAENFYRIHFINSKVFETILHHYDYIHDWNCTRYSRIVTSYYTDCLKLSGAMRLFEEEFTKSLNSKLFFATYRKIKDAGDTKIGSLSKYYDDSTNLILGIFLNTPNKETTDFLNSNEEVINRTKELLEQYYKYKGKFVFIENDLPF